MKRGNPAPHASWRTPKNEALVRKLWDAGVSFAQIARRVGCSKTVIARYVYRNQFPLRGSPIVRKPPPPPPAVPKREPARIACRPLALAVPTPRFSGCQFIAGDDRHTWTKCGAATAPGRPYCPAHCAVCYLKPGQKAWMLEAA